VAGNAGRNALFGAVAETCGLQGLGGGGCSLAKPVSNANNRDFFENPTQKQVSDGPIAAEPSKFDHDPRELHGHPGTFLLFRKTGV
jgi:hypothetical protein